MDATRMPWLLTFLSTIGKSNHLEEIKLEVEIFGYPTLPVDWSAWGAVDSTLVGAHFQCLRKIDIVVWGEGWYNAKEPRENLVREFSLLGAKGVSVNVH
jgi:hypothetical protein